MSNAAQDLYRALAQELPEAPRSARKRLARQLHLKHTQEALERLVGASEDTHESKPTKSEPKPPTQEDAGEKKVSKPPVRGRKKKASDGERSPQKARVRSGSSKSKSEKEEQK